MTTAVAVALVGAQTSSAGVLGDGLLLLGDDFMPWIVLAFGAAMIVGNGLALVRPPTPPPGEVDRGGDEPRPPVGRALVMIVIGAVAAIWGIASLVA